MNLNFIKNIKILTTPIQRIYLALIIFLNIFTSFFEIFALATIPLFVAFITKQTEFFEGIFEYFHFLENIYINDKLNLLIIIIISIFVIKTILILTSSYTLERICYGISSNNARKMLKNYFDTSYLNIIKIGPSIIQRNILENRHLSDFIVFYLKFIKELISAILIIIVIFSQNNLFLFFIFLILFALTMFLYLILKKIFYSKSKENQVAMGVILRTLVNIFSTIKNITLLNKKKYFINYFNKQNILVNYNNALMKFFTSFPRAILELLGVTILMFISYYYLNINYTSEQTIVMISLIAVFTIKLAPTLSNLASSLGGIESRKPSIELIINELSRKSEDNYNKNVKKNFFGGTIKSIKLDNLSHSYNPETGYVLKNINLNIESDKLVGIFGESGSGKTTLINILMCLIKPNSGNIIVNGRKNVIDNRSSFFPYIGYVPQDIFLFEGTLKSNIALGENESDINQKRLQEVINLCELEDFVENLSDKENHRITSDATNISGGQRQRIGLARTLYFNPNILIMDESTNELDINTEKKILEKLKKIYSNKIFIIISHRMTTLAMCDERLYLDKEKIEKINNFDEIEKKLLKIKQKENK